MQLDLYALFTHMGAIGIVVVSGHKLFAYAL